MSGLPARRETVERAMNCLEQDVSELDALMAQMGRQRYVLHKFMVDQHGPLVLAAVHDWGEQADVLIVWDENTACAYRTPSGTGVDVFAPREVCWFYTAGPVWTLRNLLELPQPTHPDAPRALTEPPAGYALPEADRRPVTITMRER